MNYSAMNWKKIALVFWVTLSTLYIAYDIFDNFKNVVLQNVYTSGQTDTIAKLIEQASNKECKPFSVYIRDNKVDLVNVACLQQLPDTQLSNTSNSSGAIRK